MKKYRIITNGKIYRVQRRFNLGILHFWHNDHYYEINDTYPKVIKHTVEFGTKKEAAEYVKQCLDQEQNEKTWKVVKKFSD